jgi:hypothetical protein
VSTTHMRAGAPSSPLSLPMGLSTWLGLGLGLG